MENRSFSKKLMLACGILAALVILCSQAFQRETTSLLSKIKKEKTEQSADADKKFIMASPADAVTSGQAVEAGETNASFIREIILDEDKTSEKSVIAKTILGDFLKTLFHVIISPQAP